MPAGITTGGQFAREPRTEPDIALVPTVKEPTTDVQGTAFRLGQWTWDSAQKSVDAANRRLERAGIENRFEATWGEPFGVTLADGNLYQCKSLALSQPSIGYDGWQFAATLSPADEGLVVRTVPGADLGGWAPQDQWCDHCQRRRHRAKTYVLGHESGDRVQVGSSCIQEFLGVKPQGLCALDWSLPEGLEDGAPPSREGGGVRDSLISATVRDVVAASIVATDGGRRYVSRAVAQDDYSGATRATADAVQSAFLPSMTPGGERERQEFLAEVPRVDSSMVDDVLEVARNLPSDSDYGRNLRVLSGGEVVGLADMGFMASAVSAWAREKERAAVKASYVPPVRGYLAPVGEKVAGTRARVSQVRYVDGYYGQSTLVVTRADSGHDLKWFASGTVDVEVGAALSLKGGKITITLQKVNLAGVVTSSHGPINFGCNQTLEYTFNNLNKGGYRLYFQRSGPASFDENSKKVTGTVYFN